MKKILYLLEKYLLFIVIRGIFLWLKCEKTKRKICLCLANQLIDNIPLNIFFDYYNIAVRILVKKNKTNVVRRIFFTEKIAIRCKHAYIQNMRIVDTKNPYTNDTPVDIFTRNPWCWLAVRHLDQKISKPVFDGHKYS